MESEFDNLKQEFMSVLDSKPEPGLQLEPPILDTYSSFTLDQETRFTTEIDYLKKEIEFINNENFSKNKLFDSEKHQLQLSIKPLTDELLTLNSILSTTQRDFKTTTQTLQSELQFYRQKWETELKRAERTELAISDLNFEKEKILKLSEIANQKIFEFEFLVKELKDELTQRDHAIFSKSSQSLICSKGQGKEDLNNADNEELKKDRSTDGGDTVSCGLGREGLTKVGCDMAGELGLLKVLANDYEKVLVKLGEMAGRCRELEREN